MGEWWEALERLYSDRLPELVERLAHHAVRGDVWAEAVSYSRQAGHRHLERSAYREAATAFEQALAVLQHLPETRSTVEQGVDVRLELRNALFPLRDQDQIPRYLEEAERLALTL